jgi:phage shock protein A
MDEQQYQTWWTLHRRVAKGESLSAEERRVYEVGRRALEAEEWASLRQAAADLRPLQERLRELTAHNQQLAQQEAALRERAAELEQHYLALTGEKLGLEV